MHRFLTFVFCFLFTCLITWAQTEEPIQIKTSDLTIDGTLTIPTGVTGPMPVVLLIAGSGPTDRNGNNPIPVGQIGSVQANTYKLLADSLANLKIATVRYDKRMIGRSAAPGMTEQGLTFETYITDAEAWIKQLKADKRFTKVIVAGHSEGSLIGMVAARKAQADAYISIAGSGDDITSKLKTQLKLQLSEADRTSVFAALDSLKAGYTLRTLPTTIPMIRALFRPTIQPYMISWMKYDPVAQIKLLTVPVLIIQGKHDIQVAVADAELLKAARPDATYVLVDQMNHILKNAPIDRADNIKTYTDPILPLTPGLATTIARFIKP